MSKSMNGSLRWSVGVALAGVVGAFGMAFAGCAERLEPPGVECAAHPSCGLEGPACAAGLECIAIRGCPSAVCISAAQACLESCGSGECDVLESFPAQLACPEGEPAPGNPGAGTCEELEARSTAELEAIQACSSDAECGQELVGTSCGCTRNLVARADADASRFYDIQAALADAECDGRITTCDCPAADGFACRQGRCTWNYLPVRGTSLAPEAAP